MLGIGGFVYILTNKNHSVLYIGVTSDLQARINEHRDKRYPGSYTAKYNAKKLVYYEMFDDIVSAIDREKYLKRKRRSYKLELINDLNPDWLDLFDQVKLW